MEAQNIRRRDVKYGQRGSVHHKEKDVNVRITAKQSKLSRFDVKNVPNGVRLQS